MTLFSISSFAQEKITLYLTRQGEITKESNAYCMCDSEFDFDSFRLHGVVNCFFLDGKPKLNATYSKGIKSGDCEIYHRNGHKLSKGAYSENKRSGIWYYYYPNGNLKQTVKFLDDVYSREYESNIMVGEFYDEGGKQLIKSGNGKWYNDSLFVSWFDRTNLKSLTGEFKDSLKHGSFVLKEKGGKKPIQDEKFNRGKFITGSIFYYDNVSTGRALSEGIRKLPDYNKEFFYNFESFKLDTTVFSDTIQSLNVEAIVEIVTGKKFEIKSRDAGYLHGNYELLEYISRNIKYPAEARRLGYQGTVIVQVTIDKDNKAKNVKILKSIHPSLDNEALRIVNSINEWICALSNGKPYEKALAIPIRFAAD